MSQVAATLQQLSTLDTHRFGISRCRRLPRA